ncbi:MAG: IS200/IS605 family transposase [Methanosarcinales archaeon]|nr:MAG: IS200/IS605 family transposase [Methanosarcinales archaeon]
MEAKTTRSSVFHTNYHIVFCPMYRRKVFKNDIAEHLEQFFRKQVEKKGWALITIDVRPDHIHLAIEGISPITRLSDVVKYLKGTSGLSLFKVFPKLRRQFRKGRIWSRGYYLGTAGEVSSATIKNYIERVEHD